jgi:hypothetical protein
MRLNELRIGNFVYHKAVWSYRQKQEPFIEFQFAWNESDWFAIGDCTLMEENIEHIPLTKEWLLKFGFYLDKDKWYNIKYFTDYNESIEEMCICINLVSNRCAVFDAIEETDMVNILSYPIMTAKRIYYVHQLQNLYFALTGIELQVKL